MAETFAFSADVQEPQEFDRQLFLLQQGERRSARGDARGGRHTLSWEVKAASQQLVDLAPEIQAWRDELQAGRQEGTTAKASLRDQRDALRRSEQEDLGPNTQ